MLKLLRVPHFKALKSYPIFNFPTSLSKFFLLAGWLVFTCGLVHAQTITIPSANTNNNAAIDTTGRILDNPFGNFFGYERSAIIYTGAEIGISDTIKAIGFYLDGINAPADTTPVRIFLKQISAGDFDTTTFVSGEEAGATLVFDGYIFGSQLVPGAWLTIPLTFPFAYSNANNLKVIVETNGGNLNGGTGLDPNPDSKTFRFSATGSIKRFQYWQQDAVPPNFPGNLLNYRPNIRLTFTPAPTCVAGTWMGTSSADWHTASNWCNNQIPTASTDVIIPAGTPNSPIITANAIARNLTINNNASLTFNVGSLTISGLYTNNGTFSSNGNGSLIFTGNNLQTLGKSGATLTFLDLTAGAGGIRLGGPASVRRLLTLNGNLNTNGQAFNLLADATYQAMVVNNSGTVTGTATIQRYINPSVNSGPGYRHLSSPVSNATIAQLNDPGVNLVVNPAYNSNPNPGTSLPFPTIFRYNENRLSSTHPDFNFGWESPASLAEPMQPAEGFTVNMPPVEVTFSGNLNNGTITTGPLTRGSTTNSGWHLVGNPYPSPIDWDKMGIPAGLDHAVYVYRSTGQYTGFYVSYVNGIGNAGLDLIPAMQSFFVRTNSGTPALTFTNSARATTYQNPALFRPSQTETRPLITLSLGQPAGPEDKLYIYAEPGASANFDSQYDALKLPNAGIIPTFYSLAGNEGLSVNGLPALNPATIVPLAAQVNQPGIYQLEAAQIANLPASLPVHLEDRLTGTITNLRQQNIYSFTTTQTSITNRFFLRFSGSGINGIAEAEKAVSLLVYPNPNKGDFMISLISKKDLEANAVLRNPLGQEIWKNTLKITNKHLEQNIKINNLPGGFYFLEVETPSGILQQKIIIQ